MKLLASLRKRTKSGISVWNFCYDEEMDVFYAHGGENLETIRANDRKHLRTIYNNWKRYGFSTKLPTIKKQQLISDPWDSVLPVDMQLQLDALAA